MSIYAVIGVGPNDLEIPLVMFPTEIEAKEFVSKFPMYKDGVFLDEDFSEHRGVFKDEISGDDNYHSDVGRPLYEALFKDGRYYAGCGGCYRLIVSEVVWGKPIVGWDLD